MTERASPTVAIDGAKLQQLRLDAYLSQREMGERAGVRTETISRLETGRRVMVYRSTLRRLAEALAVGPGELLHGD